MDVWPRVIKFLGPPYLYCTETYESLHKTLRRIAVNSNSQPKDLKMQVGVLCSCSVFRFLLIIIINSYFFCYYRYSSSYDCYYSYYYYYYYYYGSFGIVMLLLFCSSLQIRYLLLAVSLVQTSEFFRFPFTCLLSFLCIVVLSPNLLVFYFFL